MSDLADLKLKRRNIKSSITRIQNSLPQSQTDPYQLQTDLESVTDYFKEYNTVQFSIEKIQLSLENANEDELEEENNKERGKIELQYRTIISKIKSHLNKNNPASSSSSPSSTVINITNNKESVDNVSIKPLPLPNFTGKHSEWFTFYESFKCLVGNDDNISDICKFHYLKGCLKDEALRAIESLSISGDNYSIAIELLKKRFENERVIVDDHIINILKAQPLSKSSYSDLRILIDTVNNNLAALKVLKQPVEHWDALLVRIIFDKLDFTLKREWQKTLGKSVPTYDKFNEFLEQQYQVLESVNSMRCNENSNSNSNANKNKFLSKQNIHQKSNKFSSNVVSTNSCFICKKQHSVFQCKEFLDRTVENRIRHVNSLKLCQNCLRNNHESERCRSTSVCKECGQKHHTLLHVPEFVPISKPSASILVIAESNQVLFSTVLLLISSSGGKSYYCRGVLDQCSEVSLITENMCKKLNLLTYPSSASITGVNISENIAHQTCNIKITSRINNFATELECFVLPKITRATPAVSFDKSTIELPNNIVLADPNFNISQEIDLLIGARLYWQLLIGGPIQLHKKQPFFQETVFGWLISGDLDVKNPISTFTCNVVAKTESNLEKQVAKFWENETFEPDLFETQEMRKCEEHFRQNTFRAESGRFVVKLPFKDTINLGESRSLALKRFLSQEKRFEKDFKLASAYKQFMGEYRALEHMELVPFNDLGNPQTFYLPHLAVYKQAADGPKIRIVYDCSAKSSNGLSLNDCLSTGGNLQNSLFEILCRFRTYRFAISADITKMYRMIEINPEDTNFLRIFWRENNTNEIETYRLRTLIYGLTCAPFIAIRCLKQLALDTQESHPIASTAINRDFYMDDFLSGSDSLEKTLQIKNEVTAILAKAGFELCKWSANDTRLLEQNCNTESTINFSKNDEVKVLGFYWNCSSDELKYKVNTPNDNVIITKRSILSTVAKIFDPLGLINPVVVKAKILLQQIWTLKLGWDQSVPNEIETIWKKILNELAYLNDYRIPRKLISSNSIVSIELHGFADSSSKAYGAVVYVKTIDSYGNSSVTLLCAKSKVAPIKKVTLPRLELNAAVLLCRLMIKVNSILNLQINCRYFWTDSTIVLCWLAESADNWSQYVANRVDEIHKNSNISEWHHVRSNDNSADIISRGMLPRQLKESSLWWHGPQWLNSNSDKWPSRWTNFPKNNDLITERKSKIVNIIQSEPQLPVMTKFSCFRKLERVIAYCLRFINNLRSKTKNQQKALSPIEIENADVAIFKYIQSKSFADEIQAIKNSKVCKSSKIYKLDPFIDDKGLLRVGGRLKHAPIGFDNKFPILLPEKHIITKTIIRQFHEDELHAGNEGTLAAVRQKFWPISGRNTIRKVIHLCVKCTRANPKPLIQKMGNLPKQRVQPARPFLISGVDFAGPYLIKSSGLRNAKKVKAYIALFVCFSTKAVHLELVGDLTTESFLASFKRFTSRRGHVKEIFSDNGSNFVGAERELFKSENFKNKITTHFLNVSTKFNFIPARSPHFGGLWERSIQSVKHHLKRVLGDASISYEEFYTLLTRIEACLNSRPLTPLSQDPNDFEALTPGHFLIGARLTTPVERDITDLRINSLSRWQRIQQLQQHFWQRWQKEYLSQLQKRPKGQQITHPNISVGTLVVLIDDNLPPLQWRLGRVVEVHPGSDGVVRVVSVKTISGVFKRATKKVCVISTELE